MPKRGLLGVAVHPDFAAGSPYVYALYAYDPPETAGQSGAGGPDGEGQRVARLTRLTADPATGLTTAVPGSATTILGAGGTWASAGDPLSTPDQTSSWACGNPPSVDNCLPADAGFHSVGTVAFGPDGMLYVGSGDGASFSAEARSLRSLDLDSAAGKILRIDPATGLGLPDNPHWDGNADSTRSRVWYSGLRNPYRFSFDDGGQVWVGDVGAGGFEEVNTGAPGSDFGWPCYEGGTGGVLQTNPDFSSMPECQAYYGTNDAVAPTHAYSHADDSGAIIGGPFIPSGSSWPPQYQGGMVIADYERATLTVLDVSGGPIVEVPLATQIVSVGATFGPDGHLYLAGIADSAVLRIRYAPGVQTPGLLRTTTIPPVPSLISLDGLPRTQWGVDWLQLDPGTYQRCFSDVPGFVTPVCEDVEVASTATTVDAAVFAAQATLQVTTRIAGTTSGVPSVISIDGAAADDWGVFTSIDPGLHEICWGPVADQQPPPCQTVDLVAGAHHVVEGVFTPSPGAPGPTEPTGLLRVLTTPAVPSTVSVNGVDTLQFGLQWVPTATGTHTICFSDVPGFTTPPCETVTVVEGQTTVVDGIFGEQSALRAVTVPATDVVITVDGVPRNQWGLLTAIDVGPATVCAQFPTGEICEAISLVAGIESTVNLEPGGAANQPPVAAAGPDQIVVDADGSGSELVPVDGTGSTDPDGTIVSWTWTDNGTTIGTGATPTLDLPIGTHTIDLTVTDNDAATATDTVTITVEPPPNQPPVAAAGPDQIVVDADGSGSELVPVDGTGSTDPDGTIVSWTWTDNGTTIGTGATPTLDLPIGTHTIDLTVTDNDAATATDTVTITVEPAPNQPPVAAAGADRVVVDVDGSGSELVAVDGTGSTDPDGTIVSWTWTDNGTTIGTGATPTLDLPIGTHTIDLTVTDNDAATATDTVTITVEPPPDPVIYISATGGGTVAGVGYADEDVLAFDTATGTWSLYLDGGDVGLTNGGGRDIDALSVMADGSVLVSMQRDGSVSGVGFFDEADILRFVPTSTGPNTSGTFSMYLDASDVGLGGGSEDIDGVAVLDDGSLLITTVGSATVPGVSAQPEDVMRFVPSSLGTTSAGTWSLHLDGSDVGLSEDAVIVALTTDGDSPVIRVDGEAELPGLTPDQDDLVRCGDPITGPSSACTFDLYWSAGAEGFGGAIDGASIR